MPYRLIELAQAEHGKLLGHLAGARPWDVFKYIQLVHLGEDGFTGGRDALCADPGYGDQVRPDRWYLSAPARGCSTCNKSRYSAARFSRYCS